MTLLFRIDRSLVNLAATKRIKHKIDTDDADNVDEDPEVGAADEFHDAAASAAVMEAEASSAAMEAETAAEAAEAAVQELLYEAENAARAKVEEIIENARNEASLLLVVAHDEVEEEHKRARQEGFAEGSEEGKRSFDELLAEKIREDDEMLKRVLDEIHEERERFRSELENATAELAIEIVRKIINPAEEALGDVFMSLIKNALRQTSTDGKVVIRVGPVEYERFFASGAATIELDSGVTVSASVLRDISLGEGDCIIDTEDVTVNAGIESQLKYVELAFERANQYEPD